MPTVIGQRTRIDCIGLAAQSQRLSMGFGQGWIDDTDAMSRVGQMYSHRFPVNARGLHAGVHQPLGVLFDPDAQSSKPFGGVGEDLVLEFCAQHQCAIDFLLGNVDSQREEVRSAHSLRNPPCEC
ncbi:hypothetical protein D3C85_1392230 [compost metagenome]